MICNCESICLSVSQLWCNDRKMVNHFSFLKFSPAHTPTHSYTYTHKRARAHTHTPTHTCVYIHIHKNTEKYTNTHTYAHIHAHAHTCRADHGSVGRGSWVKWVTVFGWVKWVVGQHIWPTDPPLIDLLLTKIVSTKCFYFTVPRLFQS